MNSDPRRRLAIGVCLVMFLAAVYFFTFNGFPISRDERFSFDAVESLARRGDMRRNIEYEAFLPLSTKDVLPPPANWEPLQPVLSVPLFWLAQTLPGIGLAHTVWLFNVLVTALVAGIVYAYGLALGYRARAAAITALVFGLGTYAWVYSRTYFREPLFTGLALLSVLLTIRTRRQLEAGRVPLGSLLAFGLVFSAALLSKEAALLMLPGIVMAALPSRWGHIRLTRRAALMLLILAVFSVALALAVLNADTLFGMNRYAFSNRLEQLRRNFSQAFEGISGYMVSPARSLWLFSPVLLAGFAGWPRLVRTNRWREIAVPLAVLITFTVGYAAIRGVEWYGGLGWGPRYLLPVTPFVALWLLPVVEALLERGTAWWKRAGAAGVLAISVGMQMVSILVPIHRVYHVLAVQDPPIIPWQEGVWSVRWSPLVVAVDLLGEQTPDLIWAYAVRQAWLVPVLSLGLGIASLVCFGWWVRRRDGRRSQVGATAGSLSLALVVVLGVGLYAARQDPRYFSESRPLRELMAQLEDQVQPDDVILLNDYTYAEFFINYYKLAQPAFYTLPPSPGERPSPEQLPKIETVNPEAQIHLSNTVILNYFAARHDRLWLVINSGPFIWWSVRPVERYLARHYFPVSEIQTADYVRAILFDTTPAPPATAPAWPEQRVDAVFGESVQLVGFDLPGGVTRRPGDVLPVSLMWHALDAIPQDYTMGLFLIAPDGVLVAQRDSQPVHNFEHMRAWRPGSYHRDNHGVQLPASLPPGQYELWVVVYWWQAPADRLPVTGADGQSLGDHLVLTTIHIE